MNWLAKVFGGSVMEGIDKLIGRFKLSPEKEAELRALFSSQAHEVAKWEYELQKQAVEVEAQALETVNATMREEAKSESWMQRSWRPTVGFTFCAVIINNYILLPYFGKYGLQVIAIPGEVWSAIMVVLGVASATRGWQKVEEAKK